jgi:hypothetical protein
MTLIVLYNFKLKMNMTQATTLPKDWIWGDEQPEGERLELLLKHYNMWMEIKAIGIKLHDFDEYYICSPIEWDYSPFDPEMSISDIKGMLDGVDEALKSAHSDLEKTK